MPRNIRSGADGDGSHELRPPYALFLGDAQDVLEAKTAFGLLHWRPSLCAAQVKMPHCSIDLGLPEFAPGDLAHSGARSLIIGLAPRGGHLPADWITPIKMAIGAGLDIVSGLHDRLTDVPELVEAALRHRVRLLDVRHPPRKFDVANARPRSGLRLLTVGTDGYSGKKFTALSIEREMRARGLKADFRATGQTGIMIAGRGVALDAVPGDFITGAVEWLTPPNEDDHWDIIEGQGCVLSPTTAASVGLVNGAAAHAFVLCHDPVRAHPRGLPHIPMPGLAEVMDGVLFFGRRRNPLARFVGISLITASWPEGEAREVLAKTSQEFGIPATDAVRFGVSGIVDCLLEQFAQPAASSPLDLA